MHFDDTPIAAFGGWAANDAYENRATWASYRSQPTPNPDPEAIAPQPKLTWPAWALGTWAALTFLVNLLFHLFTPKDVDAWAERNPFLAKVANLFRRAGIEPLALLTAIRDFFARNPAPPAAISGNVAMGKRPRAFATLSSMACVSIVALSLGACGVFKGADSPDDAKRLAQCEAAIAEENPEADFATFVCASLAGCLAQGIRTVADVVAWVVGTDDPHAARYKPIAREAQASPAKMGALRAQVGHP
jgi:hypothetical protein